MANIDAQTTQCTLRVKNVFLGSNSAKCQRAAKAAATRCGTSIASWNDQKNADAGGFDFVINLESPVAKRNFEAAIRDCCLAAGMTWGIDGNKDVCLKNTNTAPSALPSAAEREAKAAMVIEMDFRVMNQLNPLANSYKDKAWRAITLAAGALHASCHIKQTEADMTGHVLNVKFSKPISQSDFILQLKAAGRNEKLNYGNAATDHICAKAALAALPPVASTPSQPLDISDASAISIKGEKYTKVKELNTGNSQVWLAKDSHGETCVIKEVQSASIAKVEVDVRHALGWANHHTMNVLRVLASEGVYLALEKADYSLRQLMVNERIDRPTQVAVTSCVLNALKELHARKYVHLDIKPENVMQVTEQRGGGISKPTWKVIDFDASRKVGESVGEITYNYSSIEVAHARLKGASIAAKPSMDIFSVGLVLLEMALGERFTELTDAAALREMASKESVMVKVKTCLESRTVRDDVVLKKVLDEMLKPEPIARGTAESLLRTTFFTGQVTTFRNDALVQQMGDVAAQMESLRKDILSALDGMESRLVDEVQSGTAEVKKQVGKLQRSALAPLANNAQLAVQSAAKAEDAATLSEITAAMNSALLTAQQEAMKANQALMAQTLAKVKELMPKHGAVKDEVVVALQQLSERVTTMSDKLSDVDEAVKKLRPFLAKKLDTLSGGLLQQLTGENEIRFHYFLLVPKPPTKGGFWRKTDWVKRKISATEEMILIPFYFDEELRQIRAAPVHRDKLGGHPGFTIQQPKKFIVEHPILVKVSVLTLRIAVRVGVGALGVSLPVDDFNVEGTFGDLLSSSMETTSGKLAEYAVGEESAMTTKLDELFLSSDEMLADELMDTMQSSEMQALTKDKYASLKRSLDKIDPDWAGLLGLDKAVTRKDGSITWQP